jgi:hypothetical protein
MAPLYSGLSFCTLALARFPRQNGVLADRQKAGSGECPLGNSLVPISAAKKFSARVALVDLQESSRSLLTECFRQFGIDSVRMAADNADRLASEKFEACVIQMGGEAAPVLEWARNSRSNSRIVIYGLGGSLQDVMKLSRYGINAVFNEPLERPSALKLVRATQTLVLHEFRRYVRIPVMTHVSLVAPPNRHFDASSHDVSSGGMSLNGSIATSPGTPVELSFALLGLSRIWLRGTVSWIKPASKMFAIRFDPRDERRLKIKEWVDSYIEN